MRKALKIKILKLTGDQDELQKLICLHRQSRSFIKTQTSGTSSENEWQGVATSGTTSDNEWQRVVQRVTRSDNE